MKPVAPVKRIFTAKLLLERHLARETQFAGNPSGIVGVLNGTRRHHDNHLTAAAGFVCCHRLREASGQGSPVQTQGGKQRGTNSRF
jgi:hypothetical protein